MKNESSEITKLIKENQLLRQQIESFKQNEKMLHALVETAVGDIGETFFNNIVQKLSEWLNAECIIVGQFIGNNTVEGFPMYLDGKIISGFTYQLKDTPCDMTNKKGYCVYNDNVLDLFPKSKDLIELNAKGYVGTALYSKNGEPTGILCAISRKKLNLPPQAEDILRIVGARISVEIERKNAQKELLFSEESLKKANATKDRLFSIIAHDLKAPFNALMGFSKLLLNNTDLNDQQKTLRYINAIHEVSGQTFNLLTNLLDWSLAQTNEISYSPVHFHASELISDTVASFEHIASQKNITLSAPHFPNLIMYADKNMLSTILRNLVSNAIKFSHNGGKIKISAKANSYNTTISVTDNGIGMEKAELERLFNIDNFHTTKGTANEKGVGLGLVICMEFVQKHNGHIWAESNQGKGTSIHFSIPFKKQA